MTEKPPVVILKAPKGWTPAKKEFAQRQYRVGPPAERSSPNLYGKIEVIELAKKVLEGIGEVRDGMYLLDGKRVTIGMFLQAANDVIARENLTLPKKLHTPLIGSKHHQWGQ